MYTEYLSTIHTIFLLFSRSDVSSSLWPRGLQHARLPCPSPTPGVCSNSCLLSQWCHPAISSSVVPFSSCLQVSPSIRIFSNELALRIRWPKYWSFSFSISPFNEYSGLISFRNDWLDPLAVQGALKSLRQHHDLKASILWHSVFFMVQLWQLYVTTINIIALTILTLVGKMMFLLFSTVYVYAFLPRTNHFLISWRQSPSTVILEPKKRKSVTASTFSPSIYHEVMGPDAMILVFCFFFNIEF